MVMNGNNLSMAVVFIHSMVFLNKLHSECMLWFPSRNKGQNESGRETFRDIDPTLTLRVNEHGCPL